MMFIFKTLTDVGRLAMCTTASATCWTSNVVSGFISPLGCRAPVASRAAMGVYALPAASRLTELRRMGDVEIRTNVNLRATYAERTSI